MKDRAEMPSINHQSLLPQQDIDKQPDQRYSQKDGCGQDVWRKVPAMRGTEINVLANSLTSRLRRTASYRQSTSSAQTNSIGTRSAPAADSKNVKPMISKKDATPPTVRPSILKRSLSREAAERQYHNLMEQTSRSDSPRDNLHLPKVFNERRRASSTGQLDRLGFDANSYNNQYLDRPSPLVALMGGGGGGGGGGPSTRAASQMVWVKRAGIFQPADKYAPGRQSLHGADKPHSRGNTVDYETLTLRSRPESAESDSGSSDWSGSRMQRRKGLKVSWKQPDNSGNQPQHEANNGLPVQSAGSHRQKSAGSAPGEKAAFAFTRPRFHPSNNRVPMVGVSWKVPTPKVGGAQQTQSAREEPGRVSSNNSSLPSTPATSTPALTPTGNMPSPAKPTVHTRDPRHPWRSLYPRDVHPVTTAMEREGTSVSRTKWHVPALPKAPQYALLEDVAEWRNAQWQPAPPRSRHTARATMDVGSMQARDMQGAPTTTHHTTTVSTCHTTVSNGTDTQPECSYLS